MSTIPRSKVGVPQRVRVTGDLDLPRGDELERCVRPLLVPGAQVGIDLREVEFADSSGLGALLVLNQLAEEVGATLVLVDPSPPVSSVLHLTGTADLFTVAGRPRHLRAS
jgi:anti-anti-sigma factor